MNVWKHIGRGTGVLAAAAVLCFSGAGMAPEKSRAARGTELSPYLRAVEFFSEAMAVEAVFDTTLNPGPEQTAQLPALRAARDAEWKRPTRVDPKTAVSITRIQRFAAVVDIVLQVTEHVEKHGGKGLDKIITPEVVEFLKTFRVETKEAYLPLEEPAVKAMLLARFIANKDIFPWMNNWDNFAAVWAELGRSLSRPMRMGLLIDRLWDVGNDAQVSGAFYNMIESTVMELQPGFPEYQALEKNIETLDPSYWKVEGEREVDDLTSEIFDLAVDSYYDKIDAQAARAALDARLDEAAMAKVKDFVRRAMLTPISPYDEKRLKLFAVCTVLILWDDFPEAFKGAKDLLRHVKFQAEEVEIVFGLNNAFSEGQYGYEHLKEALRSGDSQEVFFMIGHEIAHQLFNFFPLSPVLDDYFCGRNRSGANVTGLNELHSDLVGLYMVKQYGADAGKVTRRDKFAENRCMRKTAFDEGHAYSVHQTLHLLEAGYDLGALVRAFHGRMASYAGEIPTDEEAEAGYVFPYRMMLSYDSLIRAS